MKKIKFAFWGIIVCFALTFFILSKREDYSCNLLRANIEALTQTEYNPIGLCRTYCRNKNGYICILNTNVGYDVYCDNMVPWMSNL